MKRQYAECEDLVATSIRTMLANQGSNGAFVASPDFAQYRYCWLRDGSFVAYARAIASARTTPRPAFTAGAPAPSTISPR